MAHDIDDNITNSCINFCISEYVRLSEHQRILHDKWFEGLSFEELSAKYHLSVNRTITKKCSFRGFPLACGKSLFLLKCEQREVEKNELLQSIPYVQWLF